MMREAKDTKDSIDRTYKGTDRNSEMEPLVGKLRAMEGLSSERWRSLRIEQRMQVMQNAHNQIATEYGFKPYEINLLPSTAPENSGESARRTGESGLILD